MSTIAIVGAGPQLGLAIGRRFAAEGFSVAFIARREAALRELVDVITAGGGEAAAFPADVTDRPALAAALRDAERHFGTIDVLEYSPAPSAVDMTGRPVVEASEVTVESVIPELEMYVYGGITAVQQVLPGMLERGSGTIIATTGAGSGPMIIPQVANAQIATAGLRNWLLNLNASVAQRGVYVAHVALAAAIGQGRPNSEPDVIADAYWQLHQQRTEPELFYQDMPEEQDFRLSDKFLTDAE
ncbi:SDR family NAD(P)-dependent oxidoreductase [Streptomyces varsoviensis]|uniref:SDR family NAD(P)-dependent oxidoreductase n=1 Tax=Streptomyces varsoviensis TaxID=67373 RepID=UPI00340ABDFE